MVLPDPVWYAVCVSRKDIRRRISPGDKDSRHGTANGYGNHYCRCEACTAAWKVAVKAYRAKKRARAAELKLWMAKYKL